MIARPRQFPPGCREIGLGRAQGIHLVLRLEAGEHLTRLNPIPELEVVFEDAACDAETQGHYVHCLDAPGEYGRAANLALLDRHCPNRTGVRRNRFDVGLTGSEYRGKRRRKQDGPWQATHYRRMNHERRHGLSFPSRDDHGAEL